MLSKEALLDLMDDMMNHANGKEITSPAEKNSVETFISDVKAHYLDIYDDFDGAVYRHPWDTLILQRLVWMNKLYQADKRDTPYALWVKKYKKDVTITVIKQIHFGQLRIAANFASAETIYTPKGVAGHSIEAMAGKIETGASARDLLMLKVFAHKGVWVAINNRSLACHSMAKLKPVRVIPAIASADESNRLNDTHENWQYVESLLQAKQTIPKDRTLPSTIIPITDGPNSFKVVAIATTVLP